MSTAPYKKRNLGLDIVRTIAIALVLLEHTHMFFVFGNSPGVWGVEVFFVLSGFLIGQIIIRTFSDGVDFPKIKEFWIRRWFRTVPMYLLVLLILDFLMDHEGGFHWRYYLFIQNFATDFKFFAVSWSLTIEEWFYLFLPLAFWAFMQRPRTKQQLTGFLSGLIVAFILARLLVVLLADPAFDHGIRKSIPLRMDAMLMGVLLAQVKLDYKKLYKKLQALWVFILAIGLMVLAGMYFYEYSATREGLNGTLFGRVLLFPLMSIAFALAFPYVENQPWLNGLRGNHPLRFVFTQVSLMTYTLYLIHHEVFFRIVQHEPFQAGWVPEVALAVVITFAISIVLYHGFEKPMTNIRDRFGRKTSGIEQK